jgi:hypothetical protein
MAAHTIDHHQKNRARGGSYRHPVLVFGAMTNMAELGELHWRTVLGRDDDDPERPRTG